MQEQVTVRELQEADILSLVSEFTKIGWNKPVDLFEHYLKERKENRGFIWVAAQGPQLLGYVTLQLHSEYLAFADAKIPEVKDLNVLPAYRNNGIGSKLLDKAEAEAVAYHCYVGIGVGLSADYGNAQKLYIKRGYVPDGKGISYQYLSLNWGDNCKVDDDLVLWFTKKLA